MFSPEQILEKYTDKIIAPLSGYTSYPFRKLLREYGFKGLLFTEMLNPFELANKRLKKIEFAKGESPLGVQLFGGYFKDKYKKAIKFLSDNAEYDIIDLNMGCPVKKIIRSKGGVYLLNNIEEAELICDEIRSVHKGDLSIKTRIGFKDEIDETIKKLKRLLKYDPAFFTIHFRSVSQGFSGVPKWEYYERFKRELGVFIYLNGGIYTQTDILSVKKRFKPDGIMLSRGILENPFLFSKKKPSLNMKIEFAKKLILYYDHYFSESSLKETRKFIPYLFKGEIYSKSIKEKIFRAGTLKEYLNAFDLYEK